MATAIVFGVTSRIAREVALRLAERGMTLVVTARELGETERIAADIRVRTGSPAVARSFDARATGGHQAFVAEIEREFGPIETAVLAFGDMGEQREAEHDPAMLVRVLETNFVGAAALCEALAEPMVGRGRGAIAVLGSVAGDRGRQSNYIYGSAKGGLAVYLQGLRNRLFSKGVHVVTVKLGFIDTRMTWGLKTKIPVATPEAASVAIVAGIDRRTDTLYYPPFWRAVMGVIRAVPERAFKRLSL